MLSTNTISTFVPNAIVRFAGSLSFQNVDIKRLSRPGFYRDAALHSAYAKFTSGYGNWVDSLFDEHFLAHGGAATLIEFAAGKISRHDAAIALAYAWDNQMGPVRSAVRRVASPTSHRRRNHGRRPFSDLVRQRIGGERIEN